MSATQFEELARHASRTSEGARLEFIHGRLGEKAGVDGNRGAVIAWLTRLFLRSRPELWLDPLQGLLVESNKEGRARRDRVDKPRAYASTGIPVYLLVDRETCEIKVHSQPDGGRYEQVMTLPFGKDVTLPDPVGITLDTEPLKNWVR
ncbi:Uma2 family endonuclease [Actinomycetota bacterium Odt1-20B]